MTDLRQTKEYASFLERIGWIVERRGGSYYYIKKIPLLGSAIKLQGIDVIPRGDLEELARKYRAFEIIVEPRPAISDTLLSSFSLSKTPYLPTKTLQIDIDMPDIRILSQMKKDGRYSIRKSEKQVVIVQESIEQFRKSWKSVVQNKRHVLPLMHLSAFKESFGKNMILLQSEDGSAGGMFLKAKDVAYYWIGYTSEEARRSLVQYQIVWSGIRWAKKRGAKVFDFEGIYDERFPIKGWIGFTHFKRSFGGQEVLYPGCFIKWRLPL